MNNNTTKIMCYASVSIFVVLLADIYLRTLKEAFPPQTTEPYLRPTFSADPEDIVDNFILQCQIRNHTGCLARLPFLERPIIISESLVLARCKDRNVSGCATVGFPLDEPAPWRLSIVLSPRLFEAGREFERRDVVWHELGHALLARPHTPMNNSNILSLMYPYGIFGLSRYTTRPITNCSLDWRFDLVLTSKWPVYCTQMMLTDNECVNQRFDYLFDDSKYFINPPKCLKYLEKLIVFFYNK